MTLNDLSFFSTTRLHIRSKSVLHGTHIIEPFNNFF